MIVRKCFLLLTLFQIGQGKRDIGAKQTELQGKSLESTLESDNDKLEDSEDSEGEQFLTLTQLIEPKAIQKHSLMSAHQQTARRALTIIPGAYYYMIPIALFGIVFVACAVFFCWMQFKSGTSSSTSPQGRKNMNSPPEGSTLAEGSFAARLNAAQASAKSHVHDHGEKASLDAAHKGIDPAVAQSTVKCVTRFATMMCVIVAVLKVGVYVYSQSAAVKTSALDSMGDLVANCITLYTGYRMNKIDSVMYPVGQLNFEPIGVLVFSTLMASAMFANALNNVEDLLDSEDLSREDAIETFFKAAFGDKEKTDDGIKYINMEKHFQSAKKLLKDHDVDAKKFPTPVLKTIFAADSFEKAWDDLNENPSDDSLNIVGECADIDTLMDQRNTVFLTVGFLAGCALYKFCLWLYVTTIAIPRSASSILVALAADKRNDFIATTFVITCMLIGFFFQEQLGEEIADKMDPGASLILSLVIVYTWVSLMIPQMSMLSRVTVASEILEPTTCAAQDVVKGTDIGINSLKCYKSSSQNTIEVELQISSANVAFKDVMPAVRNLVSKLGDAGDVERVLILMPAQDS